MRKALIFALTVAIALGGIGFAHAVVTDSQDDLVVYPISELGDPSVLEGLTASMTFACGDHLRWYTDHTFGGETVTDFHYDRKGIPDHRIYDTNNLDIYLTAGLSSSTNGTFAFRSTEYGGLFQAVAEAAANGGQATMELSLGEYAKYYVPDYSLDYEDDTQVCRENASLQGHIMADGSHGEEGSYHAFLSRFRFPVQEKSTVSVTVEKNAAGGVSSIDFTLLNGPELFFAGDCTAEGIWFVPMFRDETGTPLAYESPQGHGIYFAPWKDTNALYYTYDRVRTSITPDLSRLELVYPLADDLLIDTIRIADGEARLLTRQEDTYKLTIIDLATGETTLELEVLPHDPDLSQNDGSFLEKNGYLLVTAQRRLALVDLSAGQVVLTAPDRDQQYNATWFNPATGDLRFDGQTLLLIDATGSYRAGAFWTAAYRQGELAYYGEYDCSLLRGNENFYNGIITADQDPVRWK